LRGWNDKVGGVGMVGRRRMERMEGDGRGGCKEKDGRRRLDEMKGED